MYVDKGSIRHCAYLALVALFLTFRTPIADIGASPPQLDCVPNTSTVSLGEGAIEYDRAGRGFPVILLHGLFAQKEQWRDVLCDLASAGFEAIAPDLPGFGQSKGYLVTVYDLHRQVDLLGRFADNLRLEHFALAGNSMGGAIAALYAERHTERVCRLAFVGPPMGLVPWGPQVRRAIIHGVNPFIPTDREQFDLEMSLLFAKLPEIPDSVRDALIHDYAARQNHYQQIWNIVNLFDSVLEGEREDPLGIEAPVMILWGASDAIYPVSGAELLHERLSDSRLIILPDTGHLPMMEKRMETGKRLIEFLRGDVRLEFFPDRPRERVKLDAMSWESHPVSVWQRFAIFQPTFAKGPFAKRGRQSAANSFRAPRLRVCSALVTGR